MRRFTSILPFCYVVSSLWLPRLSHADTFYTAVTETGTAPLANLSSAIWTNDSVAAVALGNQLTNAATPTAGNSYVALSNGQSLTTNSPAIITVLRANSPYTFPGDSLTLNTNTALYVKGVGKTNTIANLILNGGLVVNGDGNSGANYEILDGNVQATPGTVSYFDFGGSMIGTNNSANRTLSLRSHVSGSGDLLLVQGATVSATNLNVLSTSNTFSGRWIIRSGYLKGTGLDSLGTNSSILVDPLATQTNAWGDGGGFCAGPSKFEVGYDINSAGTLILTNGGTMVLHQNCAFSAVTINGTSLANGTYPYATLAGMFPGAFASGGSGAITVRPYTNGLPALAPDIASQPVFSPTNVMYAGETVQCTVVANGGQPLYYQWLAGATGSGVYTNLSDGGTIAGSTSATLTLSNLVVANAADYVVVVSNSLGRATSSVATLTVLPTGSALNITMVFKESAGQDWNTGFFWSDGNPASLSVRSNPGSTYEVMAAAVMRTPAGAAAATFPGTVDNTLTINGDGNFLYYGGNQLMDDTIGILVVKAANGGRVDFPHLILNGGEIDSPVGTYSYGGHWEVRTNTPIFIDGGGNSSLKVDAWLTGAGTIDYEGVRSSSSGSPGAPLNDPSYRGCLTIFGTSNTFSGQWVVNNGNLLGVAPNCLGTNSITIGDLNSTNYPTTKLETLYDINSPEATLNLNGMLYLHQNDTFKAVNVCGVPLSPGTYTAEQLSTAYPSNFPASWPQLANSTYTTASGSLTVLGDGPLPRASITHIGVNGTTLSLSATNGLPNATWYLLASTNPAVPLNQWTPVLTNVFDGSGRLDLTTNIVNSGNAQQFFILKQP